jgi:hypothetical protein
VWSLSGDGTGRRMPAADDGTAMGMTNPIDDPLEGVNEADRVEQAQDLDGGGTVPDGPIVSLDQATEADALEQGAAMNDDDGFTH